MTFSLVAAIVGWGGTAALLVAYGLVSAGRLSGKGVPFQVLNVLGSAGLGVAAVEGEVWSAAVLNAVWVSIGLVTLLTLVAARGRARPTRDAPASPTAPPSS